MKRMFLISCLCILVLIRAHGESVALEQVNVGTHPVGNFVHTIGVAMAKVLNDHTKLKAVVKPMSGPEAWMPYMARGEIHLGVINMVEAAFAAAGRYEWERISEGKGFPNLRLVCPTVPNRTATLVAADSRITKMADLKGKKVAGKYTRTSMTLHTLALLANGGLEEKDVIMVPVHSPADGVRAVMEGRADAAGHTTPDAPVVQELNAKKGARFLPLDPSPELVEKMKRFFPGYMVKVKEGPDVVGIKGEQYMWAYDFYVVALSELPEPVVYSITKALYENCKEFELVHKRLAEWNRESFLSKNVVLPYHPGAVKYFKEKGIWTKEMEEIQSRLLSQTRR